MASADSIPNISNPFKKTKLQENLKELPKKPEPRMTLINPVFTYPQLSLNQNNFGSNHSEKKNNNLIFNQRFNSSHSVKRIPEYDFLNQFSFMPRFPNLSFGMPVMSSQFKSFGLMNSFSHLKDDRNMPLKINPNSFMLNSLVNENEEFYKEKKEENKNNNNNNKTKDLFNQSQKSEEKNNSEKSSSPEKSSSNSNNDNINNKININNITNTGTKFFTNHNYGYKCSCSKTKCNRKYCECYNSGNYCVDCNCKDCNKKRKSYLHLHKERV